VHSAFHPFSSVRLTFTCRASAYTTSCGGMRNLKGAESPGVHSTYRDKLHLPPTRLGMHRYREMPLAGISRGEGANYNVHPRQWNKFVTRDRSLDRLGRKKRTGHSIANYGGALSSPVDYAYSPLYVASLERIFATRCTARVNEDPLRMTFTSDRHYFASA